MLLASTRALRAGMQLAQPVTHPRQDDVIVLERGYVLNDEVI